MIFCIFIVIYKKAGLSKTKKIEKEQIDKDNNGVIGGWRWREMEEGIRGMMNADEQTLDLGWNTQYSV